MPDRTPWRLVFALFSCGVIAAFLIGKVPVALPVLRSSLGLSVVEAGLLVSLFSLVAAASAALFGAFADRRGQRRTAVAGLVLAGAAGLAGAAASSIGPLLAARIGEGIGFFLVVVSLPPLILKVSREADRQKAMGLWGAFLPAGAAIIMLCGGWTLAVSGWPGLWILCSVALLLAALWLSRARLPETPAASAPPASLLSAYALLRYPGPVLLAAIFSCYSAQFLAVTAFVPLLLVEDAGWSVAAAGTAGAMILAVNITGNLASGFMLDMGWPRRRVLLVAAVTMALTAICLLSPTLPITIRLAAAAIFSAVGGLIPGALFSGVARHAPDPGRISTVNGLLLQGVALGQLAGPSIASLFVEMTGSWSGALWFSLPVAVLMLGLAFLLGRQETER
ncbi:MAG: MFS transporter [Pseudomonadota bacterium]